MLKDFVWEHVPVFVEGKLSWCATATNNKGELVRVVVPVEVVEQMDQQPLSLH